MHVSRRQPDWDTYLPCSRYRDLNSDSLQQLAEIVRTQSPEFWEGLPALYGEIVDGLNKNK